jgi:maltooligosyltrehalose trehalohydrolase
MTPTKSKPRRGRVPADPTSAGRRLPVGAEAIPGGGGHFRVWAPRRRTVEVVLEPARKRTASGVRPAPLEPEGNGYFSGAVESAAAGRLYRYRLDGEDLYPDPASRFQPAGPQGPSQIVDPASYRWRDRGWPGVTLPGQVIYELHVGTFTRPGTWSAAADRLAGLAELGITLLQVMPIAEFPGAFGWGYDGVDLFAPYHGYGRPDDFRRFVDRAHAAGLGVLLDVVYNHFGPSGNFLREYSLDYFSDRYETEWGYALNFDGPNAGPVREFFAVNAGYWIEEFHLDGLRLDATQTIQDRSGTHVVAEIVRTARAKAAGRSIVVTAENEPQQAAVLKPPSRGGWGVDALWNDDFHHSAMVALTGRREAYYHDYQGTAQELVSTAKWGFLYQGQYYSWQEQRRGTPAFDVPPAAFVHYLQNHDQVANSLRGERLISQCHPGDYRALTAFWLLTPGTPLFFQGQESGAVTPFLYFADHGGELAGLVTAGRLEFLAQFQSLADPEVRLRLPAPADPATFRACKLEDGADTAGPVRALHRDLLRLRREDAVFRAQRSDWLHGAVLDPDLFALRYLGGQLGDRLIVVNLGRDRDFIALPEPLLAPPADSHWDLLWSSERVDYGGHGTPPVETERRWRLPGHAALVFAPRKVVRLESR